MRKPCRLRRRSARRASPGRATPSARAPEQQRSEVKLDYAGMYDAVFLLRYVVRFFSVMSLVSVRRSSTLIALAGSSVEPFFQREDTVVRERRST